jgi:hypothetical protein
MLFGLSDKFKYDIAGKTRPGDSKIEDEPTGYCFRLKYFFTKGKEESGLYGLTVVLLFEKEIRYVKFEVGLGLGLDQKSTFKFTPVCNEKILDNLRCSDLDLVFMNKKVYYVRCDVYGNFFLCRLAKKKAEKKIKIYKDRVS